MSPISTVTAPPRVIAATVLGTVLEWYDFAVYGALAAVIGKLFFPSGDPTTSLLIALASYAVGFVCRPIGSIVLGRFGDRAGRRNMLAITMVVVGGSSLLIGLLPTYASVGLLAPVLLVVLRMIQGLAVGAEWTGGATYLIEYARIGRRGFFGGLVQASTVVGFLSGTGVAAILIRVDQEWAWRVPFLIGGLVAVIGLFVRLKLDESPAYLRVQSEGQAEEEVRPGRTRKNWLLLFGIVFGITLYGYTATSWPAFLAGVTELPLADALMTNVIALAVEVPLIVLAGSLSDRVGRRPLMIGATAVFTVGTYPMFLLATSGTVAGALAGQLLFVITFSVLCGPMAALFVEMFPTRVRSSAFSSSYNIAVALFGGTAPFVNTFLATRTGSHVAPAYYLTAGAIVSLVLLVIVRDRHREELD
ncbi:MFS transporter [Nonomuraea angiospora]|uniref:MHS family proline/betaine transporter-like MFS transporter n=1 Tax=Nonomuraea angiospora TaxID=46172 RepID=A0ABR9LUN6_9ACTN|nr:MFS transporter [Nonomuraea angiospora]MBE1584356.1 MHS family proline/betaine transporter-like MFS transporter [Nonomuraea angiospora]